MINKIIPCATLFILLAMFSGCASENITAEKAVTAVTIVPESVSQNQNKEKNEKQENNNNDNITSDIQESRQEENSEISENSEKVPEKKDDFYSDYDEVCINKLNSMSLEQKIGQMFMVTPEMLTDYNTVTYADENLREGIENTYIGGIILFSQNLSDTEQTKQLLSDMQSYSFDSLGTGLFTAVDEEGGTVARCADNLGTTAFYNMQYYGNNNNADEAYNIGYTIGTDLKNLGFNVDFAPVADININPENELGSRIFSDNVNVVSNMILNEVRGFRDSGTACTLKHFPGLGAESGNSHTQSEIVIDRTIEQLREEELQPFASGIGAGAEFVMVGHQKVTCFEDNLPADLSYKAVTEILRCELGFDGIAITDSHIMNTISDVYSSGEAAVMAIKAGIDIILMPQDIQQAEKAVCEAVENGEITQERIDRSVLTILEEKEKLRLLDKPE